MSGRAIGFAAVFAVLAGGGIGLSAPPSPAARALPIGDADPADREALVAVCAACHPVNLVEDSIRSQPDWVETIQAMVDRGAKGSDAQYDRIVRYLRLTLTSINVNEATAEDLADILGVSDATAQAIVARRSRGKLGSLADLEAIAGVDARQIEFRKARIAF